MTIRLLRKTDVPAAAKIVRENYDAGFGKSCVPELNAMFSKDVSRPKYFAAIEKGELIGFAGYVQSWMDYSVYEILWVNTRRDRQHSGIGKRLVEAVIADIRKQKGAELILLSANHDRTLQKYYAKVFGFKAVYLFGKGKDRAHLMYLDV